MSTFTTAKGLEQVARGGDLGTWDTPTNSNLGIIDAALGQVAIIPLNNSNVVLSSPQFQCNLITFNSTLTGSVNITFPTSFTGFYSVQSLVSGTSAFTITLQTTATGGQVVGAPPGEIIDIFNDGTNIKYRNLGRVGSYIDIGGSSVPNWIGACTVAPYLNCDGTAFSSATFPALATFLGGTTLPDSKGRSRFALDQGAGRLSSAIAGFSPNTVGSAGGSQLFQQHNHNLTVSDPTHTHGVTGGVIGGTNGNFQQSAPQGGNALIIYGTAIAISNAGTGITVASSAAGTGTSGNISPAYIGGLTMIRSA